IWVTLSLIQFVFAIITRGSIRLAYDRLRGDNGKGSNKRTKVVIVGAGSAGALVVREIRHALAKQYQPVCFVDDDPGKQYCSISGVPVLGVLEDLPRLIEQYKIDEIIIAIPSHEQQIIQRVAKINLNSSIKLKVIPGIDSLIDGTVDVKRFRDVEVEDLLGREPIKLDLAEIAAYLKGKRVLVTGAGGSIGSELCRQIASFDPELLILLGRGENSIYEIGLEMQELFPH
ncbi:MAG TPA: polysaccharide biosynthesis protein, partial [Firmicutes bacterium]|nr:polysaccharide biosynthesis protein [Bacillota bacterium]